VRIGLLGGTFDPIHLGHLRAAEVAREALALEQVWFVPAGVPPHRPQAVSPGRDRFAMVALATTGHPRFSVSDVELEREGPSFTVDTLRQLRGLHPEAEFVLIVGSDTFAEMDTWREHETVFGLATVAVVVRPGAAALPEGARAVAVEGAGLPISATEIRERARAGRSVRYLVTDAVADFIAKRGLYR
jgi:nicotinate-nucleotide adenylyltransferase